MKGLESLVNRIEFLIKNNTTENEEQRITQTKWVKEFCDDIWLSIPEDETDGNVNFARIASIAFGAWASQIMYAKSKSKGYEEKHRKQMKKAREHFIRLVSREVGKRGKLKLQFSPNYNYKGEK